MKWTKTSECLDVCRNVSIILFCFRSLDVKKFPEWSDFTSTTFRLIQVRCRLFFMCLLEVKRQCGSTCKTTVMDPCLVITINTLLFSLMCYYVKFTDIFSWISFCDFKELFSFLNASELVHSLNLFSCLIEI